MTRNILFVCFFLVILLLSIIALLFYQGSSFKGKVRANQDSLSINNSYIFVSPLRGSVAGQESIRITIFVLNNNGLGVMGKKIVLESNSNLTIKAITDTSDDLGKAVFDVSSSKAGEYYLEAKIGEKSLPQRAHLSFY